MNFVIIGGGVGGCETALRLADKGHKITLIERREELLSGASGNTPCRLGLGFHYSDEATAKKYLHATITMLKRYSQFVNAKEKDSKDPLRRWRYLIVPNTQFPFYQIDHVYNSLKEEYRALVEADPTNQVLGRPDDFYQYLSLDQYQDTVNPSKVIAGIETAEQVLDWPGLKKSMISDVEKHPNISVVKQTEVIDVKQSDSGDKFSLTLKNHARNGNTYTQDAEFLINSSWDQIEYLNSKAGFFMPKDSRTMRTKVIIEIEVPPALENSHSLFFAFGPHCSFTNCGNSRGFLSYEPVTNIEGTTGLNLSEKSKHLVYSKASQEEIMEYGRDIIKGASEYIPALKDAKVLGARFGVVKTKGTVNINSANSEFHRRDYSGVEEKSIGLINNACMKLLYFIDNATEVDLLVDQHIVLSQEIDNLMTRVTTLEPNTTGVSSLRNKVICNAIKNNLRRNTTAETTLPPNSSQQIQKAVDAKKAIHEELQLTVFRKR